MLQASLGRFDRGSGRPFPLNRESGGAGLPSDTPCSGERVTALLKPIRIYVKAVDKINTVVGTVTRYFIFVMIAILLFESVTRSFFDSPNIWTMEMAQFTMAAYYLLGGGFSLLIHSHVRMDVLYSRWFTRKQAKVDAFTSFFLIFYLAVLLYGGISSTAYSIEYDQRNYSAWSPPLAPIKIIMVLGIVLTLLQAVACFFKDLAAARGEKLS